MLLTTIIFNLSLLAAFALVSMHASKASAALKAALIITPLLIVGNRVVIPAIYAPYDGQARVEFWQDVVPGGIVDCKVAVHRFVMDTVEITDENVKAFSDVGVCLWEGKNQLELILGFNPKVFIAGHGELVDGKDTVAGIPYDWIRERIQEGQQVAVFSCRTGNGGDWVVDYTPHLERGMWVYGRKGATLYSHIMPSANNFFRKVRRSLR